MPLRPCRANSRCIGSSVVVGVFPADAIQESILSGIVNRCSRTWTKAKAESKEIATYGALDRGRRPRQNPRKVATLKSSSLLFVNNIIYGRTSSLLFVNNIIYGRIFKALHQDFGRVRVKVCGCVGAASTT